jgi:hypothetical protein
VYKCCTKCVQILYNKHYSTVFIREVILVLTVHNSKTQWSEAQCVGPTSLCLAVVHLLYTVSISIIFLFSKIPRRVMFAAQQMYTLCTTKQTLNFYFLFFLKKKKKKTGQIRWGGEIRFFFKKKMKKYFHISLVV